MRTRFPVAVVALVLAAAGCDPDRPGGEEDRAPRDDRAPSPEQIAATYGAAEDTLSPEAIERGRLDPSWQSVVQMDTTPPADALPNPERWDDITAEAVNTGPIFLPLHGDVAGPSVVRIQILLDRVVFSPGIIDGRWGKNTEKAVYWFQRREELPATGRVGERTFARLAALAGEPAVLIREHRLTEADVAGPFTDIPADIHAQAELDCMCYESRREKLAERFHTTSALLGALNPDIDLNAVEAGDVLQVPAARDEEARTSVAIDRLVISDGGHYLHALDTGGRIVFHFPSTLGSAYDPSPEGEYHIASITEDAWWHYQPDILAAVPDTAVDARIPPGPNSPIGRVWIALSKPHYGIHGTSAPETIGYATSAGCVRLTNWDALYLSRRIEPGVAVEFRDASRDTTHAE